MFWSQHKLSSQTIAVLPSARKMTKPIYWPAWRRDRVTFPQYPDLTVLALVFVTSIPCLYYKQHLLRLRITGCTDIMRSVEPFRKSPF
jgi:hypothetical protein